MKAGSLILLIFWSSELWS